MTKKLAELKRENAKLKKMIHQLQGEIEQVNVTENQCPKCDTKVKTLNLNNKTFLVCPQCKWRTKINE